MKKKSTIGQNISLSIQMKLLLFFGSLLLFVFLLGLVMYVRVSNSIVQSQDFIAENRQIFAEINQLFESSGRAQSIFEDIRLFEEGTEDELSTLRSAFNEEVLAFDILLNILIYGAESEEFRSLHYGLDHFMWSTFGLGAIVYEDQGRGGSRVPSDARRVFDRTVYEKIGNDYEDFVYNVNESVAAQKKYLRVLAATEENVIPQEAVIDVAQERDELVNAVQISAKEQREVETLLRTAQIFAQRASKARNNIVEDLASASEQLRNDLLAQIIAETQKQQDLYRIGAIVLVVSIFAIALLASIAVQFFVVRPLRKITLAAQSIVNGERDLTVPFVSRGDEIGVLSRSLSSMVEALVEDAETLEVQIGARTKQLDKKNTELESYIEEIEEITRNLVKRDVELTQANARLKEADEAKSEFVSVAAHQLRTPLTAIRWIYEMLSHAKDMPDAHKDVIKNGSKATENLIVTVNDMLNVARIDEGRMGYTIEPHDLSKLLSGILTEFEFDAKHKGLTFVPDVPDGEISFSFDWEKLDMVVRNLLSNAMKYTSVGGEVRFAVKREVDHISIVVADTGIGIPEHQQKLIFSKFFRADNALLHQTNGSGLGLYVTRDIVEKHHGTITFESIEKEGTTVSVKLPLTQENGEDDSES